MPHSNIISAVSTAKHYFSCTMEQYIDTGFSKDFAHNCNLLLELETQQLAFLICDKQSGKIHALKRLSFNTSTNSAAFLEQLKNVINKEDLLHLPFRETRISLAFHAFTLVPRSMYEESLSEKYLTHSAHVYTKDSVDVNSVKSFFLKNIYSADANLTSYLKQTFPGIKLFHITTSLLEYAAQNKDDFAASQLIIDVRQDMMHILYMQQKEFIYLNQFQYTNKEDFLYYVLLVCDQLDIDRTMCDLKLSGYITSDAILYNELYKFIANISFVQEQEHFKMPEELRNLPMHYYNTLMSLYLCE
jgi:hypothetical protein